MRVWLLALLALILLAPAVRAAPPPPSDDDEAADPETSLVEGNRRFRDGDLEGAMRVYAAGYSGRADPVLAYNLGVAAHHLGRLPEAVLWYRRAQAAMGDDLWLRDNLEIARSSLGAPERTQPAWARWAERRRSLIFLGILLAWLLPLLAARPERERWLSALVALVALLAFLAFTAGTFLGRLGPRAAVLLADCPVAGAAGLGRPLPAGSEVWVSREPAGWRVTGDPGGPVCPPETVALVEP